MKKLYKILPLALIFCFMVGCQDKEAMAELEEFKAQEAVEEQNKEIVSIRGTFQATHKGNFFGVEPTGVKLSCPALWMFRVKEGKIQESWIDWDSLYNILTTQLGMELKPKEGEK